MCHGANILILEDEPITALDLTLAVEAAGGIVLGPAATIAAAFAVCDASQSIELPVETPAGDHSTRTLRRGRGIGPSGGQRQWGAPTRLNRSGYRVY
jgi:hypothetical protein